MLKERERRTLVELRQLQFRHGGGTLDRYHPIKGGSRRGSSESLIEGKTDLQGKGNQRVRKALIGYTEINKTSGQGERSLGVAGRHFVKGGYRSPVCRDGGCAGRDQEKSEAKIGAIHKRSSLCLSVSQVEKRRKERDNGGERAAHVSSEQGVK